MLAQTASRWCGFLAIASLGGCFGPGSAEITGKVTFQGKPLPSGRIVFFCDAGNQPVITANIVNGVYTAHNAVPGNARVTVATFETNIVAIPGAPESPKPDDVPGAPTPTGEFVAIPDRYRMPDTSGLTYTIVAGKQTKDFDLAP